MHKSNLAFCFSANLGWTCWSVTSSTWSIFLLMVMAIQLIRAMTDRHSVAVIYEASLGKENHGWLHPTFNIFRYEEGREAVGVGVLLLWVKYANTFRVYRAREVEGGRRIKHHKNLFLGIFVNSFILVGLTLFCSALCSKDFCFGLVGW